MFQVLDYITHAEEDVVNEERQQVSTVGHVNECVTSGAYEPIQVAHMLLVTY